VEHKDQWKSVLAASARLQEVLPGAVLVGGTAAAHHAGHRISLDDDHVLADLRDRFDQVLEALEATDGWATARVQRPVQVLGALDGIPTGIRQLRRRRELEIEEVMAEDKRIRIPTLPEIARIKGWMILNRNATRDHLDFAALSDRLGLDAAAAVVTSLDEYYEDQLGPGGDRIATQLVKHLADPRPYDLDAVDLLAYRRLEARWQDWSNVATVLRDVATTVLARQALLENDQ
jgi:hypothetical protein